MDTRRTEHRLPGEHRGIPKVAVQERQLAEAVAKNVEQLAALADALNHGVACTRRLVEQIARIKS